MRDKKCNECPFDPNGKMGKHGEAWGKYLDENGQVTPRGCHQLEDVEFPKPENVCLGHREYLEKKRDAS